jgi:hypothetical protein
MVVAMTIVVVPVVSVPAVLIPAAMPAPITTPVVDRALDYYRAGRHNRDGRRCHVDRNAAGADEAADHTADEPAERGVAGVVAMGEGPQGECREGQRYA